MKAHEKRFIIEVKIVSEGRWVRSVNDGFYATREDAQAAITANVIAKPSTLQYRVRMK